MIYTYTCDSCGTTVHIEKPMSESSNTEICLCGAQLRRVYNTVAIRTNDNRTTEE